ncbi:serine/threonine protein kinase [Pleurocapsa sp. FMAR1]|uniref:serine/threonine protein kinase n=1 Tax=Pleurocapsa sp. FMAR1 TaxID=3040204 RepID=UPI0029C7F59F|nr:serine/threonine-protein kinase [Pleurocapsa sp. FMAR1]
MNDYPNLIPYGYKINAELGRNREGGRITWKGVALNNQRSVVIKQFCFATTGSTWSGYKAYEQEIKVLEKLDYPGIPKYLGSIETDDGFCLVQEYISASNLDNFRQLSLFEIQQIAGKILEILVYLQQQNPSVIHRDLKPENILLSENLQVYLIDFGFACLGSIEASGSSVFKGTPGFIAPEQIIKPTLASDLYSLGVTLVCLISDKSITEIRDFTSADDPYQLSLKSLLPELERQFRQWLAKMTNAKVSKRFPNALTAQDALSHLMSTSSSILAVNDSQLNTQSKPIIIGTLGIFGLSTAATWSLSFVDRSTEPTLVNIAIATVAAIAIGITELGAVEIAKIDPQAKTQGAILAIITPALLVTLSGIFWGIQEAVSIAAAITVGEIVLFAYFWWQIPIGKTNSPLAKIGYLLSAIALGISLGLKLI